MPILKNLSRNASSSASASFETKPYKLHKLDNGPSTNITIDRNEALKFYTEMNTIRRLEAAAGSLYKEKIVRGFCHLYSGQVNHFLSFSFYVSN